MDSTRERREAFPHLEAKATLDAPLDALMLSQLTTKHCIPKGEAAASSGTGMDFPPTAYRHHPCTLNLELNISVNNLCFHRPVVPIHILLQTQCIHIGYKKAGSSTVNLSYT